MKLSGIIDLNNIIIALGAHDKNTVIEELAAGYFHKGEVLKFAEVKIAIRKGDP